MPNVWHRVGDLHACDVTSTTIADFNKFALIIQVNKKHSL